MTCSIRVGWGLIPSIVHNLQIWSQCVAWSFHNLLSPSLFWSDVLIYNLDHAAYVVHARLSCYSFQRVDYVENTEPNAISCKIKNVEKGQQQMMTFITQDYLTMPFCVWWGCACWTKVTTLLWSKVELVPLAWQDLHDLSVKESVLRRWWCSGTLAGLLWGQRGVSSHSVTVVNVGVYGRSSLDVLCDWLATSSGVVLPFAWGQLG